MKGALPAVEDIAALQMPFTAYRLRPSQGIWVNPGKRPASIGLAASAWTPAVLAPRWGYAVPGGASFDPEHFDLADSAQLIAEAYGGEGVAGNGGGARAGLLCGVQVKGIGINPLVGRHTDLPHSSGVLFLERALTEAIYACLLDRMLPLGSVPVYGVMATGIDAVYHDRTTGFRYVGPGAMLLREPCLRVGHFLRAPEFESRNSVRPGALDDVTRVRNVQRELAARSRGNEGFERLVFDFLSRCASQFGAARARRIIHGSLTPSNLGLDGRWLDLSHTSILPSGRNYKMAPARLAFLQESHAPLNMTAELIHTFNKYNRRQVLLDPFVRHYTLAWQRALPSFLLALTGLSSDTPNGHQSAQWLCDRLLALVSGDGRIVRGHAQDTDEDPLPNFIAALYRPLLTAIAPDDRSTAASEDHPDAQAFASLLRLDHARRPARRALPWRNHVLACCAQAYRNATLSAFFFRERVDLLSRSLASSNLEDAGTFLGDLLRIMDFSQGTSSDDEVVLLDLPSVRSSYRVHDDVWLLQRAGQTERLAHASDLLFALESCPPEELRWHGFDFFTPTRHLLALISGPHHVTTP